jgi:hypothetical protein
MTPVTRPLSVVMQHDVRRPGAARPGPAADDAGDAEHAAHGVGLEPLLHEVGDAGREQPGQVERRAYVDLAELGADLRHPEEVGGTLRADARRYLVQQRSDERTEAAHPGLPALVGVGVPEGELADLGPALRRIVRQPQVAPVAPGCEVRTLRVDVVAVLGQLEIADHAPVEPADDVGQRRHGVVGAERVLGHRRAAHDLAPLQHQHAAPGLRQVRRRDEPVVPPADDHHVVRHGDILTDPPLSWEDLSWEDPACQSRAGL